MLWFVILRGGGGFCLFVESRTAFVRVDISAEVLAHIVDHREHSGNAKLRKGEVRGWTLGVDCFWFRRAPQVRQKARDKDWLQSGQRLASDRRAPLRPSSREDDRNSGVDGGEGTLRKR